MICYLRILILSAGIIFLIQNNSLQARAMDTLTTTEKSLATQSFEYVWKTIHEKHYDPTFGSIDWQGIFDCLYPDILQAKSKKETSRILARMIDTLGLSHYQLIPSSFYTQIEKSIFQDSFRGTLGLDIRVLDNRVYVVRIKRNFPVYLAGIPYGSEIISVNQKILYNELVLHAKNLAEERYADIILSSWVNHCLKGEVGDSINIVYRKGVNDTCAVNLTFMEPASELFQVGFFPPEQIWIETDTLHTGIGYIAFNAFMDPVHLMPVFNTAVEQFMDSPGIIIDLRGNPGGLLNMVQGMGGWFIVEKGAYIGSMCYRDMSLRIVVSPRPEVFRGKLAILIDGHSACAAEIMAAGLRDAGRARLFGSRSAGAVLGSTLERLPNGDGFQYATACYKTVTGEMLEGGGLEPDEQISLTPQLLLQRKDPVIEAAIQWIEAGTLNSKSNIRPKETTGEGNENL
ncbi:MAG: hypothetical protein JSW33_11905 [bacterium]|nr:MAG: hypothetical protein JSW33_11905 [bacterium]